MMNCILNTRSCPAPSANAARRVLTAMTLVAAALSLASCSDSADTATGPGPDVASVQVFSPTSVLTVGQTVQLTGTARGPSGSPLDRVAIVWRSSDPSVATVNGSGLVSARRPGSVSITGSASGQSDSAGFVVRPAACGAPTEGVIFVGQSQTAALRSTDCLSYRQTHARGWRLDLATAATLQIDLISRDFDTFLIVTDLNMTLVALDDDSGEGLNSRIERPFSAGSYIVWASSYAPGQMGNFELRLQERTASACQPPVPLPMDQTVTGRLSRNSCQMSGWYYDQWLLDVPSTLDLQIDLRSSEFGTYILLGTEAGDFIDENVGGEGSHARLQRRLTPGRYLVIATSNFPGDTGPYELSARTLTAGSFSYRSAAPILRSGAHSSIADILGFRALEAHSSVSPGAKRSVP